MLGIGRRMYANLLKQLLESKKKKVLTGLQCAGQ